MRPEVHEKRPHPRGNRFWARGSRSPAEVYPLNMLKILRLRVTLLNSTVRAFQEENRLGASESWPRCDNNNKSLQHVQAESGSLYVLTRSTCRLGLDFRSSDVWRQDLQQRRGTNRHRVAVQTPWPERIFAGSLFLCFADQL